MATVRLTVFALILSLAILLGQSVLGAPGDAASAASQPVGLQGPNGAGSVQAPDDHGNDPLTATNVGSESDTPGNLETGGDVDFFEFEVNAGQDYVFETSLGTLQDSVLTLLDAAGNELDFNDDIAPGVRASRIEYTADTSGILCLVVGAYTGIQTGTYTLSIHRVQAANISVTPSSGPTGTVVTITLTGAPPFTVGEITIGTGTSRFTTNASGSADFTQSINMPAGTQASILINLTGVPQQLGTIFTVTSPPSNAIVVPSTTTGNIDSPGSTDQFSFDVIAGQTYILTTQLGTLADTVLTLSDRSGNELAFNDDVVSGDWSSRIKYTATETGTLYLEVRAYSSLQLGLYSLSLSTLSESNFPPLVEKRLGDMNADIDRMIADYDLDAIDNIKLINRIDELEFAKSKVFYEFPLHCRVRMMKWYKEFTEIDKTLDEVVFATNAHDADVDTNPVPSNPFPKLLRLLDTVRFLVKELKEDTSTQSTRFW